MSEAEKETYKVQRESMYEEYVAKLNEYLDAQWDLELERKSKTLAPFDYFKLTVLQDKPSITENQLSQMWISATEEVRNQMSSSLENLDGVKKLLGAVEQRPAKFKHKSSERKPRTFNQNQLRHQNFMKQEGKVGTKKASELWNSMGEHEKCKYNPPIPDEDLTPKQAEKREQKIVEEAHKPQETLESTGIKDIK